ncbi:uncharacterized protein LOC106078242 [Biomphalaria glabrata]|uniref:Uncharacterized protein LOC106078242 n=1 Tax=Biomphalaria glabrata TaxID=6526 RepID=A0A9U8EM56_BIOGL|nr:uncharacterized protein LOC106078242 [Biomphalaria glabrata]
MVAMINNLLQPHLSAQLGTKAIDYSQQVIIDAYIPPADQADTFTDQPLCVLDRSQLDYSHAGDNDGGSPVHWQLGGGLDFSAVNLELPEYKPRDEVQVKSSEVISDRLLCHPLHFGSTTVALSGVSDISPVNNTATSPHQTTMREQPHQEEAPLANEGGEGAAEAILMDFDEHDEKIINATFKAFQSGTLTPLIKEELRCIIQSRRLAEGKGELQVEFKSPPKKKDMTEDERKRAVKRRQQNREAAQRFRQKQKDTSDYLTKKIKRLETSSKTLVSDLQKLKHERDELQQMLRNHLLVCNTSALLNVGINTAVSTVLYTTPAQSTNTAMSTVLYTTPAQSTNRVGPQPSLHHDLESSYVTFAGENSRVKQENNIFDGIVIDPAQIGFEGSMVVEQNGPIDVFYEEVVEEGQGDVQQYDSRSDSCSSSHTGSFYESCSADNMSYLSESSNSATMMCSSNYAHSRAHTDSTSSDVFDGIELYPEEDFFPADDSSS